MPSPFPGMDPFLEGYLWPDAHYRLAGEISRQLMRDMPPRYVARFDIAFREDVNSYPEIGVMYPDVEVLVVKERAQQEYGGSAVADVVRDAPAPVTIPLPRVRLVTVEIRDAASNRLVTAIEVLSPFNKREPGLTDYQTKRARLRKAGVHLLEIDLLRRGTRTLAHPRLPTTAYRVTLLRAGHAAADVWPIRLQDRLPVVPVPLSVPDPDVSLDLPAVLTAVYADAAYDRSIDYSQPPPPPPLSAGESEWLRTQLRAGIARSRED